MNFQSLSQPVSKESLDASMPSFLQSVKQNRRSSIQASSAAIFLIVGILFGLQTGEVLTVVYTIGFIIIFVAISLLLTNYYSRKLMRNDLEMSLRLQNFAKSNGWTYQYTVNNAQTQGVIFTAGRDRSFHHIVSAPEFQVGQFKFTTGSGRSETVHSYGYIALSLKQNLPNMLLDSKSNNLKVFGADISNLPVTMQGSQKISLEGDFDKYYTLYAPKDYDRDVRYVFTPDLMQALINESESIDIEVIDNQMLVYLSRDNIGTVEFWKRIDNFLNIVGSKIEKQTVRYQDDKSLQIGVVAPEGRKLKRGVSVIVIAIVIIYSIKIVLDVMDLIDK